MLLGHAACVMNELPFSSYFWGCRRGSHNLQVFPAPAITLVCSWLRGRPQVFPAPAKAGLLLTRGERDVCPTRLAPGGRAVYPRRGFRILNPQLGACESVTKCLRPLSLRCQHFSLLGNYMNEVSFPTAKLQAWERIKPLIKGTCFSNIQFYGGYH